MSNAFLEGGAKNPIKIQDNTFRDGHQSTLATRMRTEDMLPIAERMDQVGFWAMEVWGGATFDTMHRFLGEDPFERIKTLKKYTEERKTHVRNVRRDYREMVKSLKDGKEISEDDEKRAYDELQKLVDATGAGIDRFEHEKEKHILED